MSSSKSHSFRNFYRIYFAFAVPSVCGGSFIKEREGHCTQTHRQRLEEKCLDIGTKLMQRKYQLGVLLSLSFSCKLLKLLAEAIKSLIIVSANKTESLPHTRQGLTTKFDVRTCTVCK